MHMQHLQYVTDDEAAWLRILEKREYEHSSERVDIPDDILNGLVEKGLARRWRDGSVAITLGGIREVAQH